jgi:hypothetical protein
MWPGDDISYILHCTHVVKWWYIIHTTLWPSDDISYILNCICVHRWPSDDIAYILHCTHVVKWWYSIHTTLYTSGQVVISYYKLGDLCVCVCVSVCVCLSVRLYVSTVLNGSSPSLEGNLLRVMTRSVGYIVCVCTQRARVRMQCAHINRMRVLHWRSMKPIIASGSFIVTVYWTVMSTPNGRTIPSKLAGNVLLLAIRVKDYVLFMFTHRAHACERVCARACVIKHSLKAQTRWPLHWKHARMK